MPISKHRSIDELPSHRHARGDPENLRRLVAWSALCRRLSGHTLHPGVRRYRSIEEAGAARAAPGAERRPDR